MTIKFELTTYSPHITGADKTHRAVRVSWEAMQTFLGHEPRGTVGEVARILPALQASGAPAWATEEAVGAVDELGWYLLGPEVETARSVKATFTPDGADGCDWMTYVEDRLRDHYPLADVEVREDLNDSIIVDGDPMEPWDVRDLVNHWWDELCADAENPAWHRGEDEPT